VLVGAIPIPHSSRFSRTEGRERERPRVVLPHPKKKEKTRGRPDPVVTRGEGGKKRGQRLAGPL